MSCSSRLSYRRERTHWYACELTRASRRSRRHSRSAAPTHGAPEAELVRHALNRHHISAAAHLPRACTDSPTLRSGSARAHAPRLTKRGPSNPLTCLCVPCVESPVRRASSEATAKLCVARNGTRGARADRSGRSGDANSAVMPCIGRDTCCLTDRLARALVCTRVLNTLRLSKRGGLSRTPARV